MQTSADKEDSRCYIYIVIEEPVASITLRTEKDSESLTPWGLPAVGNIVATGTCLSDICHNAAARETSPQCHRTQRMYRGGSKRRQWQKKNGAHMRFGQRKLARRTKAPKGKRVQTKTKRICTIREEGPGPAYRGRGSILLSVEIQVHRNWISMAFK